MSAWDIATKYNKKHAELKYPDEPRKPRREDFVNNSTHGKALDEWETLREDYRAATLAYSRAQDALTHEFKMALAKEYGVTKHPKLERCFSLAWEHGHSSGYSEVANYFDSFVSLITRDEQP